LDNVTMSWESMARLPFQRIDTLYT
jgi:hypothetical protein